MRIDECQKSPNETTSLSSGLAFRQSSMWIFPNIVYAPYLLHGPQERLLSGYYLRQAVPLSFVLLLPVIQMRSFSDIIKTSRITWLRHSLHYFSITEYFYRHLLYKVLQEMTTGKRQTPILFANSKQFSDSWVPQDFRFETLQFHDIQ